MKNSLESNDVILGIDFGTSNSVISYFDKGPQVIKDGVDSLIPTKVYLGEKMYFGNHIPKNIIKNNSRLIENFKSKIGEYETSQEINNVIFQFFRYLKDIVEIKFGKDINFHTILTVPSNFNDNQRNIILNNSKKAGFDVLRLINEPTAAAFAYGLNSGNDEENILVFDVGGGTFDISLLEVDTSESGFYFEVVDSFGINDLGGNDFTDCIYSKLVDRLKINENLSDNIRESEFWKRCNKAKEKLSFLKKVEIKVNNDDDNKFILDVNNCRDMCRDLLDKLKNNEWIMNLADKINKKELSINNILLVGGSSKLIIIQDLIKEIFKIQPSIHNQVQHVVSLGACYYGALIKNKLENFNDIILIDTLPLSLGVETADGNFSVIIPKNTPLPATRSKKYTTDTPGDEEVKIVVYQGEKSVAKKNTIIGEIDFDKVSLSTNPVINISFKVDISGLISISVEDLKTNDSKNVLIKCNVEIDDNDTIEDNFEAEKLDEEEAQLLSLCYNIRNKIENLLSSDNCEKQLDEEEYNHFSNLLSVLYDYEVESTKSILPTIPELIKTNKNLDEKYFLLINNSNLVSKNSIEESRDSSSESKDYFDIDDIILQEKLEVLNSKLEYYLSKAEENGDQFKKDCIKSVYDEVDNCKRPSQKFIDDKLDYLAELFSENSKNELYNLCLFLKNGIDNNEIPFNDELVSTINVQIDEIDKINLVNSKETSSSYFIGKVKLINSICEKIYKNN